MREGEAEGEREHGETVAVVDPRKLVESTGHVHHLSEFSVAHDPPPIP